MMKPGRTIAQFRLFLTLNAKIWWRSVSTLEVVAIVLYTAFVLLVFAQFAATAVAILFTPDAAQLREVYEWYTEEVGLLVQLIFVNAVWFSQLFFTRASRMQFSENRKLIALGFSMKKVVRFLNLAGILHPMNFFFHLIWMIYLLPMAKDIFGVLTVLMVIAVNYGLITMVKARFKTGSDKQQLLNMGLFFFIIFWLIFGPQFLAGTDFSLSHALVDTLNSWLIWTPAYLMVVIAEGAALTGITGGTAILIAGLLALTWRQMSVDTRRALQQPMESSGKRTGKSRLLGFLTSCFGNESGKYLYTVWSHIYCRTQILFIYFFVSIYMVLIMGSDTGLVSPTLIFFFLVTIPVTFFMVMLSNAFGFENRELLLSLQFPKDRVKLLTTRIVAALTITAVGSFFIFILIPFLVPGWLTGLQMLMGILLICLAFLYFISWSSFANYKKIEQVSLMSLSNPVVPSSVSFTSFFVVMFAGLISFPVFESFQHFHVAALVGLNLILMRQLYNRYRSLRFMITKKLIPKLWNEL